MGERPSDGLFLIVAAGSLILGLQITLLRWVVFEKGFCRKHVTSADAFTILGDNEYKLAAYRAAVVDSMIGKKSHIRKNLGQFISSIRKDQLYAGLTAKGCLKKTVVSSLMMS